MLLTAIGGAIVTGVSLEMTRLVEGGDSGSEPAVEPSAVEPPPVRIDAEASLVNPAGNEDGAAEYVCLVNEGDESVSLTGWKLYDSEGKVDEISSFSLPAGAKVRVHPGGRDDHAETAHDLYGGEEAHVWTNSGDTIVLRNAADERVDTQPFPERKDGEVSGSCGPPLETPEPPEETPNSPEEAPEPPESPQDRDCSDFPSHAAAQRFFLAHGGPVDDPYGLDGNGDGVACESLP